MGIKSSQKYLRFTIYSFGQFLPPKPRGNSHQDNHDNNTNLVIPWTERFSALTSLSFCMTTKNLLHITLGAHGLLCYGYTVKDCPLPEALFQDHDSELKAKTIIPVNLLAGLTLLPSPTSVVAPASVPCNYTRFCLGKQSVRCLLWSGHEIITSDNEAICPAPQGGKMKDLRCSLAKPLSPRYS